MYRFGFCLGRTYQSKFVGSCEDFQLCCLRFTPVVVIYMSSRPNVPAMCGKTFGIFSIWFPTAILFLCPSALVERAMVVSACTLQHVAITHASVLPH